MKSSKTRSTSKTPKDQKTRSKSTTKKSKPRKSAASRMAIVVLGMHRSGTSALTRAVNMLGAGVPKTLMEPNEPNRRGYWESYPISVLNDRILTSGGSDWKDWHAFQPRWFETAEPEKFEQPARDLLAQEFGDAPLITFKDPRICRLFPFWQDIFKKANFDLRVILPLRHPAEVSASLNKRDAMPEVQGYLIWLRSVLDAEFASRGITRTVVSYEAFMSHPGAIAESLQSKLDLVWPRLSPKTLDEIEGYVDPDLRHHTAPDQANIASAPIVKDWFSTVYDIQLRWSQNGENKSDHATLDRIRQDFNDMSGPLRDFVAHMLQQNAKIRSLQEAYEKRDAQMKDANEAAGKLAEKNAALQKTVGDRDTQIAETQANADAKQQRLSSQIDALKAELERRDTDAQSVKKQRNQLVEENTALQQAIRESNAEIAAAKALAGDEQKRHAIECDALKAELNKRDADVHAANLQNEEVRQKAEAEHDSYMLERAELNNAASQKDIELAKLTMEMIHTQETLQLAENEIEGLKTALKMSRDTLEQTQSALRQRTHETDQTAADLRSLKDAHKVEITTVRSRITTLQENLDQRQTELDSLRIQTSQENEQRFAEVAALTRQLLDREGTLGAERAQLNLDVENLTEQLNTKTNELQAEKSTADTLGAENTQLLQQSALGHGLADRHSATIHAIIKDGVLGGNFVRRVADRRKARLLKALGLFDADWYIAEYSDVRDSGNDPALHFVRHGYFEGRAASSEMAGLRAAKTPVDTSKK